MIKKAIEILGIFLVGWWIIHIVEGNTPLEKANRTCDVIYWLGRFGNKEVAQGYTENKLLAYKLTEGITNWAGGWCFYASSGFFKAVDPKWTFVEQQLLNTNAKGLINNPLNFKKLKDDINGINSNNKKDN